MPTLKAVALVISALVLSGCPSEFGKDGRVAKAVHKDSEQQQLELTQCSDQRKREVCAHGKENSDECRKCGGP